MKIIDCQQGTPEWFSARLGLPTASEFDKILTPTGKPSTQWEAYANRLLAEMLVGKPVDSFEGNGWTERGNELEPEAAKFYEFTNEIETLTVGFVTNDEGTYGCSPDRLVGNDGLLELKCPAPHTHIQYLLDKKIDQKYYPQVQGQLLVTGRAWVDLVSYHPEMPPVVIRVPRDETFIMALDDALKDFTHKLQAKRKRMVELGYLK